MVSLFTGADSEGSALQAAIATSTRNLTSLWSSGDEYTFSITSILTEGSNSDEKGGVGTGEEG